MSLNIGDNFKYGGKKFLDDRESFDTLEAMKNYERVPDGFITYCKEDGKRYEFKSSNNINELTGKWTEFIVDIEMPDIDVDDLCHMGSDAPEKDSSIWFYTGLTASSSDISLDNPLITELFACIRDLQAQVQQLQADVEYLKINGGGDRPSVPPVTPDPDEPEEEDELFRIIMEDGSGGFLLEDGSGVVILEESVVADKESNFLLEDGFNLLLEDGSLLLLELDDSNKPTTDEKSNLKLENDFDLLLEDGDLMLLE